MGSPAQRIKDGRVSLVQFVESGPISSIPTEGHKSPKPQIIIPESMEFSGGLKVVIPGVSRDRIAPKHGTQILPRRRLRRECLDQDQPLCFCLSGQGADPNRKDHASDQQRSKNCCQDRPSQAAATLGTHYRSTSITMSLPLE